MQRIRHEVDDRDLALYMAYDRIDPFGEMRADLRSGIIASVIASVHGVKKSKPADFMLDFDEPEKKEKTPDQLWNELIAAHAKRP